MTKKKSKYPFVSVCTPTFNRRPFIPTMFECFRNQDYPKDKIEWIIVDDGTDKIKDLIEDSKIPQIKYFSLNNKMLLGAKRNFMHSKTTGSIIIYMDDDDYYPPDRISHAVEMLQDSKDALCAGASELYVYFKHIRKMYQCGPYGPNHATAGTFAFKRKLLDITKYNEGVALAEEREFLKDYTIPFVQLDPLKTILVFSHEHNSFDKRKLLENPHPIFMKESSRRVEEFIKFDYEKKIKAFFMEKIDSILMGYKPGEPSMKPDVLEQLKVIDDNRKKMIEEQMKMNSNQNLIMMQEPGKPPVELSIQEVVNLVNIQKQQLDSLVKQNQEYQVMTQHLQTQIANMKINENQNRPFSYELRELERLSNLNKELENENIMLKEKVKTMSTKKSVSFEDNIRKGFLNDKKDKKTKSVSESLKINEEPPVIVKPRMKSDPEVMVVI